MEWNLNIWAENLIKNIINGDYSWVCYLNIGNAELKSLCIKAQNSYVKNTYIWQIKIIKGIQLIENLQSLLQQRSSYQWKLYLDTNLQPAKTQDTMFVLYKATCVRWQKAISNQIKSIQRIFIHNLLLGQVFITGNRLNIALSATFDSIVILGNWNQNTLL